MPVAREYFRAVCECPLDYGVIMCSTRVVMGMKIDVRDVLLWGAKAANAILRMRHNVAGRFAIQNRRRMSSKHGCDGTSAKLHSSTHRYLAQRFNATTHVLIHK